MLMIEPLQNKHFHKFSPIAIQEREFEAICDIFYNKNDMHNFCFLHNGMPVLIVGLKEKWDKVFDSYTIFSTEWKPIYYKQVIKAVKFYLGKLDYDRIEHLCHIDREWTCKMIEMFGFEFVARLRKYIGGQDRLLYEVVK